MAILNQEILWTYWCWK